MWPTRHRTLDKQIFCQAKGILPFLPPKGLHISSFAYMCVSATFLFLICCSISFDINLLVAAPNFAYANFWNSDFSFVLLKYCGIFPRNFAWNIVWEWNFLHEILRNLARNSPNYVSIPFAQYCIALSMQEVNPNFASFEGNPFPDPIEKCVQYRYTLLLLIFAASNPSWLSLTVVQHI